MTVFKA